MVNQQVLEGRWNEIRGQLKSRWGQLTDDDLQSGQGDIDQLVGRIQRKTGETREDIEQYLDELSGQTGAMLGQAAEAAREYGQQAMDAARHAGDQLRQGYSSAEAMVQERPTESIAIAFGAGVVLGVLVGMALFSD